jgi:hypothetical protein
MTISQTLVVCHGVHENNGIPTSFWVLDAEYNNMEEFLLYTEQYRTLTQQISALNRKVQNAPNDGRDKSDKWLPKFAKQYDKWIGEVVTFFVCWGDARTPPDLRELYNKICQKRNQTLHDFGPDMGRTLTPREFEDMQAACASVQFLRA